MGYVPAYEQAVVSFLDVLGFADFVRDSEKYPEHVPEIRRMLEVLRDQFEGELHIPDS